jgi:hypothetical protein
MTVSVATRPIHRLTGLSELGRTVLGFVDGGLPWFEWAIRDPRARYHFEDESALVAGVQDGLHAWPFILLPALGLIVSPVKLMTMSVSDLRTLGQAETGDKSAVVAARVKQIFASHGLLTQADFAGIQPFLQNLKVAPAPVFQSLGFGDLLALHGLLSEGEPLGPDYQLEAAAFAVDQGRTPLEFVDYYRTYLQHVAAVGAPSDTPEQRAASVQTALDTLLPLLFDDLDCPRVEGLVAPWEVSAAIDEWLMMGRQLGFLRLSAGVQQVIANTTFTQQSGDDARRIVSGYLRGAQALLKSAELGRGQLGQDGASCRFLVASGDEEAAVDLGADGIISLASYRRLPPALPVPVAPVPPPAPPKPASATKPEKRK